jgi:hypothetical protein
MASATIKLFLARGDAKSLRIAEISNWTGTAIAAPRTELDDLLKRDELAKPGVYILLGGDARSPRAYIGEAEILSDRLRQHKSKEFWVSAIVICSQNKNLTKAHARFLEKRLVDEAARVGRYTLEQNNPGGAMLPESDLGDMDGFLAGIRQLLPVLGSDILVPISQPAEIPQPGGVLFFSFKGIEARGQRTSTGFVVFKGSTAVLEHPSAETYQSLVDKRKQLIADATLVEKDSVLVFTKDAEFSSPSAAAAVVRAGSANGLTSWKTKDGKTLKQLDEQS